MASPELYLRYNNAPRQYWAASRAARVMFFCLVAHWASPVARSASLPHANSSVDFAVYLRAIAPSDGPALAVMAIHDGRTVLEGSRGLANLKRRRASREATLFRIGSISKQFTAAAVLQLVNEGRLALDARVGTYVPELDSIASEIRVVELLSHTSGLGSHIYELSAAIKARPLMLPRAVFFDLLRVNRPSFESGTRWAYSDDGYYLLGLLLERVTGRSYADALRRRVLMRAALRHTVLDDGARERAGLATGYVRTKSGYEPTQALEASATFAAGGILTTARDLVKWNKALDDGRILVEATARYVNKPFALRSGKPTSYAAGWMLNRYRDLQWIEHGGSYPGFDCHVLRVPEQRLLVVVLRNCSGCEPASHVVATRVAEWLVPALRRTYSPEIACNEATPYAGVYTSNAPEESTLLECAHDQLILRRGIRPARVLSSVVGVRDLFVDEESMAELRFERDANGRVIQFIVTSRFSEPRRWRKQ